MSNDVLNNPSIYLTDLVILVNIIFKPGRISNKRNNYMNIALLKITDIF